MANQDKPHNPKPKQGQQGGSQHQGGHQGSRGKEVGSDRDRDTVGEEDLGRKQSEGNLGNERRRDENVRNRADEGSRNRDRMHDASRLPD